MNPDLYTEEFRNFRYLKSSPEYVAHFKDIFNNINKIRPSEITEVVFEWPHRIEFLEQLIDLGDMTFYVVYPCFYGNGNDYEEAGLYEFLNMEIVYGNPFSIDSRKITSDDIKDIELVSGEGYYVLSDNRPNTYVNLSELPLMLPMDTNSVSINKMYTGLFYNKATAETYAAALTAHIRNVGSAFASGS